MESPGPKGGVGNVAYHRFRARPNPARQAPEVTLAAAAGTHGDGSGAGAAALSTARGRRPRRKAGRRRRNRGSRRRSSPRSCGRLPSSSWAVNVIGAAQEGQCGVSSPCRQPGSPPSRPSARSGAGPPSGTARSAVTAPSCVSPSTGTAAGVSAPVNTYARLPPAAGSQSSHVPGSFWQRKTATAPSPAGRCARNCSAPSQVRHRGQTKPCGTSGTPPVRRTGASGAVPPPRPGARGEPRTSGGRTAEPGRRRSGRRGRRRPWTGRDTCPGRRRWPGGCRRGPHLRHCRSGGRC